MYYHSYSVDLVPGQRFQAVEHLKKLAALLQEKHGVKTEVLGNVSGRVYQHHLVSHFESLTQFEEVNSKLVRDEDFLTWFDGAEGLIDWPAARSSLYQTF